MNMFSLTPPLLACGLLLVCVLSLALVLAFRRPSHGLDPFKFPEFSNTIPGRSPSENVLSKSYGSPADPQHWRSTQFADEFEALITAEHLSRDSSELLKRDAGQYRNAEVQKQWELWCKAIALTYAKTREPDMV